MMVTGSGRSPSGRAAAPSDGVPAGLRDTATIPNADFITFTTVDGREETTVRLTAPVVLFDETDRGYRAARARASRRIKRLMGLHPCSKLDVVPHDWSNAIDALSEKTINASVSA